MHLSIFDLHIDLISESSIYQLQEAIDGSTGKPLISDTDMHALMPKNIRKMTYRYKQMCGCKICVIISSMQAQLNCYRLDCLNLLREKSGDEGERIARSGVDATKKDNIYVNDVYSNNQNMHLKPIDALLAIQCKPADGFSVPHF